MTEPYVRHTAMDIYLTCWDCLLKKVSDLGHLFSTLQGKKQTSPQSYKNLFDLFIIKYNRKFP